MLENKIQVFNIIILLFRVLKSNSFDRYLENNKYLINFTASNKTNLIHEVIL